MSKAADLLRQAEQLAQAAPTWADLSNALFDPIEGLLTRAYPTRQERQEFIGTEQFKRIQELLAESRKRQGLTEGATPQKITAFMVHLNSKPANGGRRAPVSFEAAPSEGLRNPSDGD